MGNFKDLGVNKGLLIAVEEMGFTSPTPVQEKAIPYLLKGKKRFNCTSTNWNR